VVAVALVAAACASDTTSETTEPPDAAPDETSATTTTEAPISGLGAERVVIAIADDPGTLHPYLALSEAAFVTMEFLYDNLLKLDDQGNLLPNIASEWTYVDNVATFTIRDGVTCSDGSAVTASTVASNLEWIKDPANESAQIELTFGSPDFEVTADDTTNMLTITLPQPTDYFLETTASLLPIACGSWQDDPGALATSAMGSGPYTLEEAVPGDRYVLARNDAYAWSPLDVDIADMPAVIELRVVGNETTKANLLESGEIHAGIVNGPDRERFSGAKFGNVPTPTGNQFTFFNQSEGRITADKRVRQALIMAVDLDAVAPIAAQGLAVDRSTTMIEGQPFYCGTNSDAIATLPGYDPDAAAALLDEAGWVVGADGIRENDGQRLELDAPYQITTAGSEPGAELFAEAWAAIGVETNLRGVTEGERSEIFFGTGQFDVFPLLSARPPTPAPWVGFLTGENSASIVNEGFNAAGPAAISSSDHTVACELWFQAENALYEDVSYVPVSIEISNWITREIIFRTNGSHIIPMSIAPLP
jgi:peptide/nickel transport system substrate-binding protein